MDRKSLLRTLTEARQIVITTHVGPDGDAMGSSLGLFLLLRKINPSVQVIVPNECPEFLHWMPGHDSVLNYSKDKEKIQNFLERADFIFFLDYNDPFRGGLLEPMLTRSPARKVLIDHHLSPSIPVDYSISEVQASSSAELVLQFIEKELGLEQLVDKDIATCLYTGILTDTGCFSYNSSRGETFRRIADLLERGVDKDAVYSAVYDNFSASRMRLLGHCLNNMQVFPQYHTALMTLSLEEQKEFEYKNGDAEGFVNYPLSIHGICFAAFFMEKEDKIKISFRSKGTFSVNQFARDHFHGGGHLNASGGEVAGASLSETVSRFIALLPESGCELSPSEGTRT